MEESFYEAVKRGDIDTARTIKNRRAPRPDELKRTLFMVASELDGAIQIDAIHFLRSETTVDMNARYNDNQDTVLHLVARQNNISAFAALTFSGTSPSLCDKRGKQAYDYLNRLEQDALIALTKIFNKKLREMLQRGEKKLSNMKEDVSEVLLASAKKFIDEDTLRTIPKEEIQDFLRKVEATFTQTQIVKLLRYSNHKAYQFLLAIGFNTTNFPRIQTAIDNMNVKQTSSQKMVQEFSVQPTVEPMPAASLLRPVDHQALYDFLTKGDGKSAEECFVGAALDPKIATQLLFKCIDKFEDDTTLAAATELLVKKGAAVNIRRANDFKTPLRLALLRNKMKTAEFLVSQIPAESKQDKLSRLLLKLMEEVKDDAKLAEAVVFLLNNGAEVNVARPTDLMTPMHIIMKRDNGTNTFTKTVKVLFENDADMSAQNCAGEDPQDCATAAMLGSFGSQVNMVGSLHTNPPKKSPLKKMIDALPANAAQFIAELDDCEVNDIVEQLKYSDYKAYKLFVQKVLDCSNSGPIKAAVKKLTDELHAAWQRCCYSITHGKLNTLQGVEFLLQSGANINWQEPESKKTMLHYAIEYNHVALIALLKANNARMDIPALYGVTAQQLEAEKSQAPGPFDSAPVQYGHKK
ncbi:MAG TPA: hypothetical protein VGV92_05005 [Gammaproteobacteria bacterium]|nr:hypothetical protein [Gammaproteobacteria bacterium]